MRSLECCLLLFLVACDHQDTNHNKCFYNLDVNQLYGSDEFKTTVLHWAAHNNDYNLVKSLLQSGAKMQCDYDQALPITETTNPNIVELFLEYGADINNDTSYMSGMTVLHCAIQRCDMEMVKFCIAHGADINKTTCNAAALTPLCLAFYAIKHLDDPHKDCPERKTHLSLDGYVAIIKLLIKNGANIYQSCDFGEFSPIKAAQDLNNTEILNLIQELQIR